MPASRPSTFAYVSNADSREISVFALDEAAECVRHVQTVPTSGQVMPLAISPDRRTLHASLRSDPARVQSFDIDGDSGRLAPRGIAAVPAGMAHLATDRTGRWLFGASYHGDVLSVSPVDARGIVGSPRQVLATGRHAHAVAVSPDNRHVYASVLGAGEVMHLHFDAREGSLAPDAGGPWLARPGAGPRHMAWHPGGRHLYLLNELDGTVDVLAVDSRSGAMAHRQTVSTLPPHFGAKPWAADIHVTPDGRFLYTSERTSSTLACLRVEAGGEHLVLLGHTDTERQPRGFGIDPGGRFLLAAGQLSHAMTLYRIDPASGALAARHTQSLGSNPNWVEMVELP